jgi:nitrite reductase/ring-hydroxylating ferredoxin subunit
MPDNDSRKIAQLPIVQGKRICLVLHGNNFLAVQDACTHNGESLSGGKVNYLGEIVCPGMVIGLIFKRQSL